MTLFIFILLLALYNPALYSDNPSAPNLQTKISDLSESLGELSSKLKTLKKRLKKLQNKLLGIENDKGKLKEFFEVIDTKDLTNETLPNKEIKNKIIEALLDNSIDANDIFDDIDSTSGNLKALIKDMNIIHKALIKYAKNEESHLDKIKNFIQKFDEYLNKNNDNNNTYWNTLNALAEKPYCKPAEILSFISFLETQYADHSPLENKLDDTNVINGILETFGENVLPLKHQDEATIKNCSDIIIELCTLLHNAYTDKDIIYSHALLGLSKNRSATPDDISNLIKHLTDNHSFKKNEKKSGEDNQFTLIQVLFNYSGIKNRQPKDVAEVINNLYKNLKTEEPESPHDENTLIMSNYIELFLPEILIKFSLKNKEEINTINTLLRGINNNLLMHTEENSSLNNLGLFILNFAVDESTSAEQAASLMEKNKNQRWTNLEPFVALGQGQALIGNPILYVIDTVQRTHIESAEDIINNTKKAISILEKFKVHLTSDLEGNIRKATTNFIHGIIENCTYYFSIYEFDKLDDIDKGLEFLLNLIESLDALKNLEVELIEPPILRLFKNAKKIIDWQSNLEYGRKGRSKKIPTIKEYIEKIDIQNRFKNFISEDFSNEKILQELEENDPKKSNNPSP